MPNQSHKQIKLQPKIRSLSFGQKVVPELKMSGVWLEKQGFLAGQNVTITIRKELLIIQPSAITDEPA